MFSLLASFFTVLGIISAVIIISYLAGYAAWHKIKSAESKIIIIPVGGHVDDVELFVRSIINKSKLIGRDFHSIILANMGADEETKIICTLLSNEYEFVYFCDGREILENLSENLYH